MARSKTKHALLSSIISLVLCFTMLLGTTFAWFTDEVTSGLNQIVAGNLDVEVTYKTTSGEKSIENTANLFEEVELWEPGMVAYEELTIKNAGNLALKYKMVINFINKNNLNGHTLSEVLYVAVLDSHLGTGTTREGLLSAVEGNGQKLTSFTKEGQLDLTTKSEDKVTLVVYWPANSAEVDNQYNANNGQTTSDGNPLGIDLGISVVATQLMAESDAFDNTYDKDAYYGTDVWDGSASTTVPPTVEEKDETTGETVKVLTIKTAEELVAFANSVNGGKNYKGVTVVLASNIDLANHKWTPIGSVSSPAYFQGTFDGNGYTISNLYVDESANTSGHATAGLFGWVDAAKATIKNVKIDGATVKGSHWVGVIAGYFSGKIENCSVNNATVMAYNLNDDANGDKVGAIVGYLNEHSYINNNTVTNSTITGNRDIGGIAGSVAASTISMKNNKVKDTVITYSTDKNYGSAGKIVSGRTGYVADNTNMAENVKIIKSVADGVYQNLDDSNYLITNANGFLWVEKQTDNFFAGKTIKLNSDIDFGGADFNPIRIWNSENRTTFDGQGYTISNFVITNNNGNAGLFNGTLDIKNVNVENATAEGRYVGILAGNMYGNIDNCNVKNVTINGTYWQTGALVGQYNAGNITNCTVENCTINGKAAVGALVGILNETTGVRKIENCTIKGCAINQTGTFGGDYDDMFGLVTGCINISNSQVYITNCTIENNTVKGVASEILYGVGESSTTVTIQ